MLQLDVDGLRFDFPTGWEVFKYDDWSFYRNQFSRMRNGIKSLDLLAVEPDGTAWLIEVKDYRLHSRTKPSDLAVEVADKVFDTLAAMLPAKLNANDLDERRSAHAVLRATQLRVALHMEQPLRPSKLRPRAINPADVQQKLRQLVRAIDPHAVVVEMGRMNNVGWTAN